MQNTIPYYEGCLINIAVAGTGYVGLSLAVLLSPSRLLDLK